MPETKSLRSLTDAAQACKGCPLWESAAQTVFGEGGRTVGLMLHKKPDTDEIGACHPWIDAELRAVRSSVVVAVGATAARSLLGRTTPIAASRGKQFEVQGRPVLVTYNPSAILRADDRATEIRHALIDDLRLAQKWLQKS